jgi:Ser/Thr protein kinase RdoA (MazF antagonist)
MMRLRHLFDNRDLAEMLLRNWEYDEDSLELFQYFRISANAIYPFRRDGETCFLRFCPTAEKTRQNILAELEFINYLRQAGYKAMEPLRSKNGDELVERFTPWSDYYASAFKRVAGEPVSETGFADNVLFAYGAALGQLHQLSNQFGEPLTRRWTYEQVLDWIEETLSRSGGQAPALEEVQLLRRSFSRLTKKPGTYGLLHYDFEPDNVFYNDAAGACSVIDFDDAMYHWYMMDVAQALDSLKGEIASGELPQKQSIFILGYASQFELDPDLFAVMPIFNRFGRLYRYARVTRAVEEHWENEPGWLLELRSKLASALVNAAQDFGKEIELEEAGR